MRGIEHRTPNVKALSCKPTSTCYNTPAPWVRLSGGRAPAESSEAAERGCVADGAQRATRALPFQMLQTWSSSAGWA